MLKKKQTVDLFDCTSFPKELPYYYFQSHAAEEVAGYEDVVATVVVATVMAAAVAENAVAGRVGATNVAITEVEVQVYATERSTFNDLFNDRRGDSGENSDGCCDDHLGCGESC